MDAPLKFVGQSSDTARSDMGSDPTNALSGNQRCEFPKASGRGVCGEPATEVITMHGLRWSYNAKACKKCADSLEKEARLNKGRDR
jgi:hypothetical protein